MRGIHLYSGKHLRFFTEDEIRGAQSAVVNAEPLDLNQQDLCDAMLSFLVKNVYEAPETPVPHDGE